MNRAEAPLPMPMPRALALAVVTFLMMLPETLPVPVLRSLIIERFGVGNALASLFLAANMLGALLAAPWIGRYSDRTGQRRTPAIAALLLDALLMQALAHPLDYASFLLLRVAEGAAHIGALTLLMSLTADVAGAHRGRVLGCLGASLTLGVATGAAIGGVVGHGNPLLTLHLASAVLLCAAGAATWLLPADTPAAERPGYRLLFAALRARPGLRAPLLLAFVDRFTVGFFTTGFPLLLASARGASGPQIGMLLAAFLYPFALMSYPFGRLAERWPRRTLVFWGSLVYGIAVVAVGWAPVPLLWALMPVLGIASAVMFVPTLLWLLEQSPDVGRSTAMASFHAAGSLGFLLGPICCGALVELGGEPLRGYQLAFAVAGLMEVAGAVLVVGWPRRNFCSR
ncbi:MAG: MFS transporter [Planctomycetota bacterium]